MLTLKFLTRATAVMTILIIIFSSVQSALAAPSNGTSANPTMPFQATLHHFTPAEGSCVNGVCDYLSYAYGTVNIMGSPFVMVTAHVIWNFNTALCSTMETLEFTLVGETGSITILGSGTTCPGNSPQHFPELVSLVGEVTGGTGEFDGITGTINGQGLISPVGPVIHMSGEVSY